MNKMDVEQRKRLLSLVPPDASLLDHWKYKHDGGETQEVWIFGDGEYACVFAENHLKGKVVFGQIVVNRGETLKRVIQGLQSAEDYTGKVQG
jgi:hypothetical protein